MYSENRSDVYIDKFSEIWNFQTLFQAVYYLYQNFALNKSVLMCFYDWIWLIFPV